MIFEKVQKVVADTISCELSEISMGTSLSQDLSADSLDAVEISMALEEAFCIKIPDEVLEKMDLISDIVSYIQNNQ